MRTIVSNKAKAVAKGDYLSVPDLRAYQRVLGTFRIGQQGGLSVHADNLCVAPSIL